MSVNRYAASSLQTSKLPFLQILAPLLETGQVKEDVKLSKKQVKMAVLKAFNRVFVHRDSLKQDVQSLVCPRFISELGVENTDQALNLYYGILECIEIALYAGDIDALDARLQTVSNLDSDHFINETIIALVKQIVNAQLAEWREACGSFRPSLPKLVDLDWRVDIKSSSSNLKKMPPVPSLLLNLHTQEQPTNLREPPLEKSVGMELSKEALQVMMEGLYKIRDQLNNVGESN